MTTTQIAKYSVYNKLVAFLVAYASSFAGLTRLLQSSTDFNTAFSSLKTILPSSTIHPSDPVTVTKNEAFASMIDVIVSLANRAFVFAIDTSNNILEDIFKVEYSSFSKPSEPAKIILAQNVLTALNGNSVALIAGYDITALELTAAAAAIALAQSKIAAPRVVIGNNKAANNAIVTAFTGVDKKIVLLEKLIYGKFRTGAFANQLLIDSFDSAKAITIAVGHTALIATFLDVDGNPIEGAQVEIVLESGVKVAVSDIMGVAAADTFVGGTYHVNSSAPTYVSKTQVVKFLMGKVVYLDIVLVKA